MSRDDQLFDLVDRVRDRFYGKYRGTVVDVDASTLRIKAKVPAVLGDQASGWCLPCVPYAGKDVGLFLVPDAGAAVWIEFEGGDVSQPIWAGCFWRSGELPADAAPKVRGLVTAAPHQLLFDDDADEVTLEDSGGGKVAFDSNGVTTSRGGKSVAVGDSNVSINDGALEVT
ncbi:hypothetical protein ASD16_10480 [Cellulomonas sp. Root485]|jgi:uncharacterized protein involved in type VI secretion and phage assembly|uniref:phage baseplate assembly protein V n=1 Tax=Cellulomonas sp. Root485 TaxID=1736546 RepID=UPI0006F8D53F|nr:phage baseplate assembly protein V [Cellulomonas sp. Root485]KQY23011.1 hypothetical protein ASD16_10480 [Cellulomonas sp. Root485]